MKYDQCGSYLLNRMEFQNESGRDETADLRLTPAFPPAQIWALCAFKGYLRRPQTRYKHMLNVKMSGSDFPISQDYQLASFS